MNKKIPFCGQKFKVDSVHWTRTLTHIHTLHVKSIVQKTVSVIVVVDTMDDNTQMPEILV